MPLGFESILGVTVESVQGNQLHLEWIGTLGPLEIVVQPLEFLSSFKLRQPHLVRRHASPLSSRAVKIISGFLSS